MGQADRIGHERGIAEPVNFAAASAQFSSVADSSVMPTIRASAKAADRPQGRARQWLRRCLLPSVLASSPYRPCCGPPSRRRLDFGAFAARAAAALVRRTPRWSPFVNSTSSFRHSTILDLCACESGRQIRRHFRR